MTSNSALSTQYSISPNGESFPLPKPEDYDKEFKRLQKLVVKHRKEGREIVVVMGVGFVGAVMAGIVADSVDKATGKPGKFVIGMQRPSPRSYWKIPLLNKGVAPVEAEDPEVALMIARCVLEKKTLTATYTYDALCLADVIVVGIGGHDAASCPPIPKETLGDCRKGHAEIAALEESLKVLGEKIQPHCLVLIETTVPPGTTEYVAYPILKKAFERRGIATEPLLAHSYERVMPGREYVASIRDFWRVCSGINEPAKEKVVKFLSGGIGGHDAASCPPIPPLTVLDRPIESETSKIVENSYRATTLALLGASYREDVGDTRYSGSEIVVRKLTEMGAEIVIHDPYVKRWWELEKQDTYPAPGHSWSRFFRNQEKLKDSRVENDLSTTLKSVDAVILAVRHEAYLSLDPDAVIAMTSRPVAVIDCFGILDDEKIKRYFQLGCEVKGLGRGHVKRIKDQVKVEK